MSRFDLNTLNSIVVLKPFEEHVSCETQTVDSSAPFETASIASSVSFRPPRIYTKGSCECTVIESSDSFETIR